eukprot:2425939-Pyramimonas_sp.AAC.1
MASWARPAKAAKDGPRGKDAKATLESRLSLRLRVDCRRVLMTSMFRSAFLNQRKGVSLIATSPRMAREVPMPVRTLLNAC